MMKQKKLYFEQMYMKFPAEFMHAIDDLYLEDPVALMLLLMCLIWKIGRWVTGNTDESSQVHIVLQARN